MGDRHGSRLGKCRERAEKRPRNAAGEKHILRHRRPRPLLLRPFASLKQSFRPTSKVARCESSICHFILFFFSFVMEYGQPRHKNLLIRENVRTVQHLRANSLIYIWILDLLREYIAKFSLRREKTIQKYLYSQSKMKRSRSLLKADYGTLGLFLNASNVS